MLSFDWNWGDLITGLAGLILGWLTRVLQQRNGKPPTTGNQGF